MHITVLYLGLSLLVRSFCFPSSFKLSYRTAVFGGPHLPGQNRVSMQRYHYKQSACSQRFLSNGVGQAMSRYWGVSSRTPHLNGEMDKRHNFYRGRPILLSSFPTFFTEVDCALSNSVLAILWGCQCRSRCGPRRRWLCSNATEPMLMLPTMGLNSCQM